MRARKWIAGAVIATAGVTGWIVPDVGAAGGVRVGPRQSVCAVVADADPGDLALVNVTVVRPSDAGYANAHHEQAEPDGVSSINFERDVTIANLTAIRVTEAAEVCLTLSVTASAHVLFDLVGVIDASVVASASDQATRILDTRRADAASRGGRVPASGRVCTSFVGASPGDVAVVNATAVRPSAQGYLSVFASGSADPTATSNVNFVAGQNVATMAFVPVAADQTLCAIPSEADAHIVIDQVAVLAGSVFRTPPGGAKRVLDSRNGSDRTAGSAVPAGDTVCAPVDAVLPGVDAGDVVIAGVVSVRATAPGFLTVHAPTARPGATSTHNFGPARAVSNLTATVLDDGRSVCATPSADGAVHVVVDVLGALDGESFRAAGDGAVRILDTRRQPNLRGRLGESWLSTPQTCDSLLARFREGATAALEQLVEQFGDGPPPITLPATNGHDSPTAWEDFSDTNVQVAGVDEGDLVETDGRTLYTFRQNGQTGEAPELRVVDLATRTVASRTPLAPLASGERESQLEMIRHGDRLTVTSIIDRHDEEWGHTRVRVFDVSTPARPVLLTDHLVDGWRDAMRSIDGRVRLVLANQRRPDLVGDPWTDSNWASERRAAIAASTIEDWMPMRAPVLPGGTVGTPTMALPCDAVRLPPLDAGFGIVWIEEYDLAAPGAAAGGAGIFASPSEIIVYANADRLFIATQSSPWRWFGWWRRDVDVAHLHQFDLSRDGPVRYAASAELPGRVLNQFSIGEHEGVLRVAVTSGWWDDSASAVVALRQNGEVLERIGMIDQLGVTERIYAVRHVGPLSYVVTFRQTDPLYVVDFADPARPVLRGELKIPGFSSYLHPVTWGRLVGVGYDADETGQVTGAQLSLFDVSNPDEPVRRSTLDLGDWLGGWETFDHRSFLYWPRTGTIAVPAGGPDGYGMVVSLVGDTRLRRMGVVGGDWCSMPSRSVVVGDDLIVVGEVIEFVSIWTLATRARLDAHSC